MPALQSYGHDDFMRQYDCMLDREFEFNGEVASWAPTQSKPRLWDEEDESIDLPNDVSCVALLHTSALAVTPDARYLAVAINRVVRLYDLETLELRSETSGYPSSIGPISFQPHAPDSSSIAAGAANYILVSQTVEHKDVESKVYKTVFDHNGQRVNDGASFPLSIGNGVFPHFSSQIWKHDGSQMLYIADDTAMKLCPEVAIVNMPSGEEACRLRGHNDMITWASWSPDGTLIATASWDHTFGIWVAVSGVRRHIIRTRGQNWSGAFFNDGRHILLSGSAPPITFGIYDVETADLVTSMQEPAGIRLDRWLRDFTVHPSRELVVLRNSRSLLAWTPFEADDQPDHTAVQTLLTLRADSDCMKNDFGGPKNLKWVDRGRKLIVQGEDQTIFVWEPGKQWKWRFQRPKGRAVGDPYDTEVLFVRRKGGEWVLSAGEDRIRLWKW